MPTSKKLLRSSMRKYFTSYIKGNFRCINDLSSFVVNQTLNLISDVFKEDFIKAGYPEKDFEKFFRSVFKDKIKKLRCF